MFCFFQQKSKIIVVRVDAKFIIFVENLENMYWLNLIIPALIFIPSLFAYFYPPANVPLESPRRPVYLKIFEWIGRIGLIISPLLSPFSANSMAGELALIALIVFLIVYYAGWFRFFYSGRVYEYLYLPLLDIPVPLALSSVIYFLYASFLINSNLLLISTIIFAVGHIPLSVMSYGAIKQSG
mgnify:CR=1 FL=1